MVVVTPPPTTTVEQDKLSTCDNTQRDQWRPHAGRRFLKSSLVVRETHLDELRPPTATDWGQTHRTRRVIRWRAQRIWLKFGEALRVLASELSPAPQNDQLKFAANSSEFTLIRNLFVLKSQQDLYLLSVYAKKDITQDILTPHIDGGCYNWPQGRPTNESQTNQNHRQDPVIAIYIQCASEQSRAMVQYN